MTKKHSFKNWPLLLIGVLMVTAIVAFGIDRKLVEYMLLKRAIATVNYQLSKEKTSTFTSGDNTVQFNYPESWELYSAEDERGMFGGFSQGGVIKNPDGKIEVSFSLHNFSDPITKLDDFPPCDNKKTVCEDVTINGIAYRKAVTFNSSMIAISLTRNEDNKTFHIVSYIQAGKKQFENAVVVESVYQTLLVKE